MQDNVELRQQLQSFFTGTKNSLPWAPGTVHLSSKEVQIPSKQGNQNTFIIRLSTLCYVCAYISPLVGICFVIVLVIFCFLKIHSSTKLTCVFHFLIVLITLLFL